VPGGLAPQVGLEPTTLRLTAGCSAIELLRNIGKTLRPPGRTANHDLSRIPRIRSTRGGRVAVSPLGERQFEQIRDAKHRASLAQILEVEPRALDADDGGDVPPVPIRYFAALPEPAQFLQEGVLRWMHEEPAPA
jgi:hypothetical protein